MAAQPQTKPVTGTDTMTVLCKIPQGFTMRLHEKRTFTEVGLGHSKEVSQFFPTGQEFRLNGSAHAQNEGPRCRTVGAYAVTEGVPREFWEKWLEQNRSLEAVTSGIICAFDDTNYAVDFGKENRALKTGLERLNPHDLPSVDPRFKIVTADEQIAPIGFVEE